MKPRLSRRHVAAVCSVTALFVLCLPALAGAGSGTGSSPEAHAGAKCSSVTTRNGGKVKFLNTVKASCRTGRRVARRANGRSYRFLGFACRPEKKRNLVGKLYGCGRLKDGQGQGIGFIYMAP